LKTTHIVTLSLLASLSPAAFAQQQVTRVDFDRALHLNEKYAKAAGPMPGDAHWIDDTDALWFDMGPGEYVLYDAKADKRSELDSKKLAAVLNQQNPEAKPVEAEKLHLQELRFDKDLQHFSFATPKGRERCAMADESCTLEPRHGDQDREWSDLQNFEGNDLKKSVESPDGKWEATIQNFNVYLRSKGSHDPARPLSTDGSEGNYYQRSSLQWSPDSRHLLAIRTLPGMRREVHYIESSPEDQLQPKASEHFYAKPGDTVDIDQPVLFNPETGAEQAVDNSLFPNPYELTRFEWRHDSSAFTFVYNQRGHQRLDIISVDANTVQPRRVIDETSKTFIEYTDLNPEATGTGKYWRHDVNDGHEVLWLSERDGWAHLYLYDGVTGSVKNQITHGNWVVRGVGHVDEEHRQIYFEASGVDPKLDPYFTQGYRINFDGTGMTPLTTTPTNHRIEFSSDGEYYTDRYSRVDLPPTLELHKTADTTKNQILGKSDLTALKAAGWQAPEVFISKGRDGTTDIWGLIWKPANFDPKKHYPVIEDIYAGPQGSFVPKNFSSRAQPLTELGFVVVQIDGMGTNNRSKAFHDVIWKNLKDGGFEDRILWHKAAAAKFPWYDASRVGIFGTSAGGQNALAALLFHPEFYKAAVANSGSHDNRMDKMWWNEQWMGWPIGPEYAASSNTVNAGHLQGRLMLVIGEMDRNVDPSSSLQVVNALIKANKDFELLFVPGGGHGAGGMYGQHRLMDFFVRSLTNETTVNWNAATPAESKEP
jgi:dipeptidyl aminopeptidase/acylaminoacyl peptidase